MEQEVLTDKKFCECGCGMLIPLLGSIGQPLRFKHGHNWRGQKISDVAKVKISLANSGERNGMHARIKELHPNWKGDAVRYIALHQWIRRHLVISKVCQFCNKAKPTDLANITGNYDRDFTNWKYLCHSCHVRYDRKRNKTKYANIRI